MLIKAFDGELTGQYTVLIFTSLTCKECYALKENYQLLLNQFPTIDFYEVDVDENPTFAQSEEIYSLPSIIMYKNQEQIGKFNYGQYKTADLIIKYIKVQKELNDNK